MSGHGKYSQRKLSGLSLFPEFQGGVLLHTGGCRSPGRYTAPENTDGGGGHTSVERGYSVHLLQNCVSCDKDWLKGHSGSVHVHSLSSQDASDMQRSSLCSHSDLPSSGPSVETVRVKEGNPVGVWSLPNIFKAKPG